MELMSGEMGYDRAITTFSPDGRLFQVEYAREAVKRGGCVISVVLEAEKTILFCTKKRISTVSVPIEKIFKIDKHIYIASAGLIADARVLINDARIKAQQNQLLYDEPISVFSVAKYIADKKQLYTQYAGVRPYGVSCLIAGINDKAFLYETDPSGFMMRAKARAIGLTAEKINEYLEKEFKNNLTQKQAIDLLINAFKKSDSKLKTNQASIFILTTQGIKEINIDKTEK